MLGLWGPGREVERLRWLARWLDGYEVIAVGGRLSPEGAEHLEALAKGMARGYRFRAAELEHELKEQK